MRQKKNLRRLNVLVTAQTLYNLQRLADMDGGRNVGRVVDKLTREKMLALKGTCHRPYPEGTLSAAEPPRAPEGNP